MTGQRLRKMVALAAALLLILAVGACGGDDPSGGGGDDNKDDIERDCDRHADCPDGQICWRSSPGSQGVCETPIDDRGLGEDCSLSIQCATGLCYEGQCTEICDSKEECPDGMACRSVESGGSICEDKEACENADDCEDDVCVVDRNGEVQLYCNLPIGPGEYGDLCEADADCEAGLCFDGMCSEPCKGPGDCDEIEFMTCSGEDLGDGELTNICNEIDDTGELCVSDEDCLGDNRCVARADDDEVNFVCDLPNEDGVEGGEACEDHLECAQNLCHEGACQKPCGDDDMCSEIPASSCTTTQVELEGVIDTVNSCEVPVICASPAACEEDETCYVQRGEDSVDTICEEPDEGELEDGEYCTEDADCASNYCHEDPYENFCATPCELDEDCPEVGGLAMTCETVDIDHASGSDPVDVCVREEPPACSIDEDCAQGQACAVVANKDTEEIETVCLPDHGWAPTGANCTEDSDCANRQCTDGSCSAPCNSYEQCSPYQVCTEETVAKDGASAELDLCTSLDFTACMAPSECDPENTTCNTPTFDSDGFVDGASCGFTYPGEADLGESCNDMIECESGYCWYSDDDTTGECTVFCQDSAADCASDQSCVGRVADLGVCLGDCERNADCDGGNVCKLGTDPANSELYRYCGNTLPDATKQPGDECSSAEECDNGLCLTVTTYEVTDQSCTSDSQCDSGFECACAPGDPNCSSGEQVCVSETGTVEQQCSELCDPANGNADCEGQGHELTECSETIEVTWGNVETTTAACSFPPSEG